MKTNETTRTVKVEMDEPCFSIVCDDCPLRPHIEALGQKPRSCTAGMMTKVQGAVPIYKCEHYKKNSIGNTDGIVTIICTK